MYCRLNRVNSVSLIQEGLRLMPFIINVINLKSNPVRKGFCANYGGFTGKRW